MESNAQFVSKIHSRTHVNVYLTCHAQFANKNYTYPNIKMAISNGNFYFTHNKTEIKKNECVVYNYENSSHFALAKSAFINNFCTNMIYGTHSATPKIDYMCFYANAPCRLKENNCVIITLETCIAFCISHYDSFLIRFYFFLVPYTKTSINLIQIIARELCVAPGQVV